MPLFSALSIICNMLAALLFTFTGSVLLTLKYQTHSISKKYLLVSLFILSTPLTFCMDESKDTSEVTVYAIPAQNGLGSYPDYVRDLLNQEDIIAVQTPLSLPDLGQNRCLALLRESISTHNKKGLIHATSQGTATALNYLAEDQGRMIKGLILEAVLASGNSAIEHTVSGPLMNLKTLANLPLSYYWIPYCAKAMFPFYSPASTQPIKSIAKIPAHIPVIIVHSKNDAQLSYHDACALYYGLRKNGNPAYLMSLEGRNHMQLIRNERDKHVVQNILKKHQLIEGANEEELDLSAYQPDHNKFARLYDNILYKEKKHEQLRVLLVFGSFCILVKICMKYLNLFEGS